MNLKDKILTILETQNHTYAQLAEHLSLTEKELDDALETRRLEVRTLELISKELRISLYSFFREKDYQLVGDDTESFYNVNIWSKDELRYRTEIQMLKDEVKKLNNELIKKDILIEALEGQLKGPK